eukprot:TRINITY_DN6438_c1_g1_i1.p1 TRINITY_DN6438_c1_g1~~TRINITY_DN6438_c1_g1_i1.p1  ORF type:complete len:212 (-),score=64.40 TRINITY_DN6438_c1_g1_i1:498-1133(-)
MQQSELAARYGKQEASHGVSFQTDLSNIGSRSRLFGGAAGANVLDEERRLIDKVFSIVDRDNSGSVDINELKKMFGLFNINEQFLDQAMSRIMANVDKDADCMISPQEFYQLLSQKFEKGDDPNEIKQVFHRMGAKGDEIGVDELHKVSQDLGENLNREEIKDMVRCFNKDYQAKLKDYNHKKKKNPSEKEPEQPKTLKFSDFLEVMYEEL